MYKYNEPLTNTTIIDESGKIYPLKDIANNTIYLDENHKDRKIFPTIDHSNKPDKDIPDLFDGRLEWIDYLPPLYFQQSSSWNTALARTLSARISMLSVGMISPNLSYSYMTTCPHKDFITENTDNNKDLLEKSNYYGALFLYCFGTPIITCFNEKNAESCSKANKLKCTNEDQIFRICRASYATNIASNNKSIKWEIVKYGPVVATMKYPREFSSYTGLLPFENPSQDIVGARSVIIVGWTIIKDSEYWIVDPCIGYSWGLGGHFLIKMNAGLGIEESVLSVYPDFNGFSDFINKTYKDVTNPMPEKYKKLRSQIDVDLRYFTVEPTPANQISAILQRSDYIYKPFLPDYNTFFAKDVAYRLTYNVKNSVHGLKMTTFLLLTIVIIIILTVMYKLLL